MGLLTILHALKSPIRVSALIRLRRSLGRKEWTVMGELTSLDILLMML